MNYLDLVANHELHVYPKRGVVIVRGEGAKLWDDAGNEYIDCAAGVGVASLGHNHPRLAEAIAAQARRVITLPGSLDNDMRSRLYERLIGIAPAGLQRAFFTNSGTEATEAAIKFARLTTGRSEFVSAERGFHGRSLGALSATHNPKYRAGFEPLVPGFSSMIYNDVAQLDAAVSDQTAGVILEVVQGEGGVHPAEGAFLAAARRLCDERGALLIIDEIQTGFCRTGRMFACNHHDLQPDMMCVAKAMAGGLPMGAMVCTERVTAGLGKHGSTFGGNPLCSAAALATIDVMTEQRLDQQAEEKGRFVVESLRAAGLSKVREFRGLGLMIGIELEVDVAPVIAELMTLGVIALSAGGNVLRLLPPLVIEQDALEQVVARLVRVLK